MKRLAIIAALAASPAYAQSNCGATPDAYAMLAERFGEERIWMGQTDTPGAIAEVWGNLQTGSWTFIVTGQGVTCLVTQGTGYSATPQGARL